MSLVCKCLRRPGDNVSFPGVVSHLIWVLRTKDNQEMVLTARSPLQVLDGQLKLHENRVLMNLYHELGVSGIIFKRLS